MANVEFINNPPYAKGELAGERQVPKGVMKRLEAIGVEVSALRVRVGKLQALVDGMPDKEATETVAVPGLKGSLDRIESELRGCLRPLGALEELF
jgi:hypothetical protein